MCRQMLRVPLSYRFPALASKEGRERGRRPYPTLRSSLRAIPRGSLLLRHNQNRTPFRSQLKVPVRTARPCWSRALPTGGGRAHQMAIPCMFVARRVFPLFSEAEVAAHVYAEGGSSFEGVQLARSALGESPDPRAGLPHRSARLSRRRAALGAPPRTPARRRGSRIERNGEREDTGTCGHKPNRHLNLPFSRGGDRVGHVSPEHWRGASAGPGRFRERQPRTVPTAARPRGRAARAAQFDLRDRFEFFAGCSCLPPNTAASFAIGGFPFRHRARTLPLWLS